MAKRRYGRPMKKMQPAVMDILVRAPVGKSYIDLSLCASIINRRAYKQQDVNWAVGQFELFSNTNGSVSIQKLPETWVYKNAYAKAKNLWYKMNKQVIDENPDIQGKYQDFKIYMDSAMSGQSIQTAANPAGTILTPAVANHLTDVIEWTSADFTGAVAPKSDWVYSTIQVPNDPTSGVTTEYTLHAIGAGTGTSESIIAGYGLSRARPQNSDPNTPGALSGEDWMTALFDDGEQLEELKSDLIADNDHPPYPVGSPGGNAEYYPQGSNELEGFQEHGFCLFTNSTVSGKNVIQGGAFQQGLMRISNDTDETITIALRMVPGPHRGYMCGVDA